MELEERASFDVLFNDNCTLGNTEEILPLARKCIAESDNEIEILRAITVAYDLSFKVYPIKELEEKLFQHICPAAKNIFINKLKFLESFNESGTVQIQSITFYELLNTCLEIITLFLNIFEQLSDTQKMSVSQVGSLILSSAEVLNSCFLHCKESEKVYDYHFSSLTEILSNLFKKCCGLLEQFLNFLSDKIADKLNDYKEIKILSKVLNHLSNSGLVLLNLEIKTMVKVWKTHIFLVERYFPDLKEEYNVGPTINSLCSNIKSNVDAALSNQKENQDFNKLMKLACFNLKLVVKFCEIYCGCLKECHNSLLSLLITLCKCNTALISDNTCQKNVNNELMNQLAIGAEPLLSQLISDNEIMTQCVLLCKDIKCSYDSSAAFLILLTLLMKILMHSNAQIRKLWFSKDENVLKWFFHTISSSSCVLFLSRDFPSTLVAGHHKRCADFYEYLLVTTSAFLMTSTSVEFHLAEKILIRNVTQTDLWCALLATDIWCLLVRFAESELCFIQILKLCKMLQEFHPNTQRVDKVYLISLIRRLFPLLPQHQKEKFLTSFEPCFYSELWQGMELCSGFSENIHLENSITQSMIAHVEKIIDQEESFASYQLNAEKSFWDNDASTSQRIEKRISKLWKFNPNALPANSQISFFQITCALTANFSFSFSMENLLMILRQMRKLLSVGQPSCIKLYLISILQSLSTITVPANDLQKSVIETIAEIFREFLSSTEPLVKQKTLEIFYSLTLVTNHFEIITLTVQNSDSLKQKITDYFQKKLSNKDNFELKGYVKKLCGARYRHFCTYGEFQSRFRQQETENDKLILKNLKTHSSNLQEMVDKWVHESKQVMENMEFLTNTQKGQIREICGSLVASSQ